MSKFRYKSAIVRHVSDCMAEQALRMDPHAPAVDMKKAKVQHDQYVKILRDDLGLKVIELEADHNLPDSVFVEDPVVVIETKALLTRLGHPSRQAERGTMRKALENFAELSISVMEEIDPKATMDGGDVLYTGQEIIVGLSSRTNKAGIDILAKVFPHIKVTSVNVTGNLHLKSLCTLAGPEILIVAVGDEASRAVVENMKSLVVGKYKYLEVKGHTSGSNCIFLETQQGSALIHPCPAVYPASKQAYESLQNMRKIPLDMSEFAKVDGCLTCSSVLLTI